MARTARTLIGHKSEVHGWNFSFTFQNATGERTPKKIAQCTLNFIISRIENSNVLRRYPISVHTHSSVSDIHTHYVV
jgi:hypothetical protein